MKIKIYLIRNDNPFQNLLISVRDIDTIYNFDWCIFYLIFISYKIYFGRLDFLFFFLSLTGHFTLIYSLRPATLASAKRNVNDGGHAETKQNGSAPL